MLAALLAFAPSAAADDFAELLDAPGSEAPTVTDEAPEQPPDPEPEPDPAQAPEPDPAPRPAVPGGLAEPDKPIGPVGLVEEAVYGGVWMPGEFAPTGLKVVSDVDDATVVVFEAIDKLSLAALVVIENADAPDEYRFENAVPDALTAILQPDGSVQFFDENGAVSGGIAAPWAIDADGRNIVTSYSLDGTTLVQTVDHDGAAYPVVADPYWLAPALRAAHRSSGYVTACLRAYCGVAITSAVAAVSRIGERKPSLPLMRCDRPRSGCRR